MSISQASIDALLADAPAPGTAAPAAEASSSTQPAPTPAPHARTPEVKRILGLSVPVIVMLAERDMPLESILEITGGTIIEFEVPFDTELALKVANRTIGCGQTVKVGEHFGLRVTRIGSVHDRIDALGGR